MEGPKTRLLTYWSLAPFRPRVRSTASSIRDKRRGLPDWLRKRQAAPLQLRAAGNSLRVPVRRNRENRPRRQSLTCAAPWGRYQLSRLTLGSGFGLEPNTCCSSASWACSSSRAMVSHALATVIKDSTMSAFSLLKADFRACAALSRYCAMRFSGKFGDRNCCSILATRLHLAPELARG